MEVYVLQHLHEAPSGEEDVKLIGVYASEAAARDAIGRLSMKPGFSEHPDSFHVARYEVDRDHWLDGFVSWHEVQDRKHL